MLIVVGQNDNRHLVRGWFVREFDERNNVCYRWSGREAVIRVAPPPGSATMRMMVSGAGALTGESTSFSIYLNQILLGHSQGPEADIWTMIDIPLPSSPQKEVESLDITVRSEKRDKGASLTPRVFIPDQYLNNGDAREMGIQLASIRIF